MARNNIARLRLRVKVKTFGMCKGTTYTVDWREVHRNAVGQDADAQRFRDWAGLVPLLVPRP